MKKIAVTLGDPAGIGPEVVIRALPSVTDECIPIVIGDVSVLEDAMRLTDMRLEIRTISSVEDTGPSGSTIRCIDPGVVKMFEKRRPTRENGRACAGYVRRAVELAAAGSVDAIVTAPISKESLRLAGLSWPGHTEMLAELTGTSEYAMMIVGGPVQR